MLAGTAAPLAQVAPKCRTYPTEQTRAFSTGGASEKCDYDTGTNVHTCTMDLRIQAARRIVSVRQYKSAADFVDEIRVIPPISRAVSGSTTYQPSGPGAQNATIAFNYDPQRRQTDMLFQFADGRTVKTTYSAWDASGRPTAHTTSGQAFRYAYDDAKRTMTITGPGGVQVHWFDPNGSLVKQDDAPAGAPASTTTVTINKTATVCR
jgi:YD repeat-containing protein